MFKTLVTCLFAVMGSAALVPQAAAAEPTELQKSVDDLTVYLGVMPAQMIHGHEPGHPERLMHGGVPKGKNHYHVMVAVFEKPSGRRVTEAKVRARVGEVGMAGDNKVLEPMVIAEAMTFGNYFTMAGPRPYEITVSIQRPGAQRPVEVKFVHRRQ